jgi:repressor LexA
VRPGNVPGGGPRPSCSGQLFALTVVGGSMIGAAICDGDIVTVRQTDSADHGDIVAATLGGEATVKRMRREDGGVWLMPHNLAHAAIPGDDATILGNAVAIIPNVRNGDGLPRP